MTADILFTPTDLATGNGIIHGSYNNKVTAGDTGFSSNQLRENDLTVMQSAYKAVKAHSRPALSGAYSPEARRDNCSENKNFNAEMFTACGLREVDRKTFAELVQQFNNLKENVFVFHIDTSSLLGIHADILSKLRDAAANNPVRVLIPDHYGVWRWLIPKTANGAPQHSLEATMSLVLEKVHKHNSSNTHFDFRHLAADLHRIGKDRGNLHVSFAPYPKSVK
ncbi:unnamed protein product [Ectocarpus sp. 6 AP-2014]